jgi:hypothetical protein
MKTFSYDPSKDVEFKNFVEELEKESDRGIAIICHAYIEDLLKLLLKKRLLDDKKFHKNLENRISFYQILSFCFLTGIVTETEKKEIECLSKIRNRFAHKRGVNNFKNKHVIEDCNKLRIPNTINKALTARKKYISTAAYYVQMLNLKIKYTHKLTQVEHDSRGPKMLDSLYI